jgi:MraZ protein
VFRGTHQHSIDAKGRTSLPARFRELLAGRSEEYLVVTTGPARSLWCLPPSTWKVLEDKVSAMPQFDQETQDFMHAFMAPAQDCSFDKMGRILVPPTLREYAGLEGDVFWLGAINRIELWSGERYKARQAAASAAILDGGAFPQKLAEKLGNFSV